MSLPLLPRQGISPSPVPRTEVFAHQLLGHRLSELPSNLQRMVVMKAGIDAGPKNLVHQGTRIFESVLVYAVRESLAVRKDVYVRGTKEVGNPRRHGPCYAAVGRRVLGVCGGSAQCRPGR